MGRADLAGAAHLQLVSGVVQLRPEDAMVDAMLKGWRAQQTARGLQEDTVTPRERLVRQFLDFANEYPWNWEPSHVDEWTQSLTAERHLAPSTIRGYQTDLRLFSEYLTDGHYGWAVECEKAFGTFPVPICHEWNTIAHLNDYEGSPEARPFTREELQLFLDYADQQVDRAVVAKAKGCFGCLPRRHCSRSSTRGRCVAPRRPSLTWRTGAATRRRRSSAGTGCCTCATARRYEVSHHDGATCPR